MSLPVPDIRVLIVEDDPFARDMMSMLIIRDWRTRLVGDVGTLDELEKTLEQAYNNLDKRIDVILLDTEVPNEPHWSFHLIELIQRGDAQPLIVYTGTQPNLDVLKYALEKGITKRVSGYIIKSDIMYALASAIARAYEGYWIMTPRVGRLINSEHLAVPNKSWVMDGTYTLMNFSEREKQIARLAVLFNLSRKDIADETHLTPAYVGGVVSQIYSILSLGDIIHGDVDPETIFIDQEKIINRFTKAIQKAANKKRGSGIHEAPTLAFHLLTTSYEEYYEYFILR